MKYAVQISSSSGQKTRTVEILRDTAGWRASLDGQPVSVDAVEISPGKISVLLDGQSFQISVTPAPDGKLILQTSTHEFAAEVVDPRAWRGRRHGGGEAEGRQQVLAPMPGKVVRVLVKEGERVEARQGLFVVEAMKMQNEIRSPKGGAVERVLVSVGQAVNAGEVLCVIS